MKMPNPSVERDAPPNGVAPLTFTLASLPQCEKMFRKYLKERRIKKLIKKFEEGKAVADEELVELAISIGEEPDKRDLYKKVLSTLSSHVKENGEIINYLLQLIRNECMKEDALMRDIEAHYPDYSTPVSIGSPVNRVPFDLLSELGEPEIVPLLESMLKEIPEDVEYKEWWDAEHDMTQTYTSHVRTLLTETIQHIFVRKP